MADRIRLGPGYWIIGLMGGLILTFALVFLEIVPWELLAPTFIIGWGGGNIAVLVAGRAGMTRDAGSSSMVFTAALALLLIMVFEAWAISFFFNFGLASVSLSDLWLVNILFAIYEETLFLGIRISGKAGNLPDLAVLGFEVAAFVPWHFFRYPLEMLFFVVFLGVLRFTMSAISLMTDHSDPPFYAHPAYNFLASMRWI